jgi:hypothetical protein
MKIKKEYIILVLIIIALSAYLYKRSADRTLYALPKIQKVNEKELTKIEINRGGKTVVLGKKDDRWYIAPAAYPTDTGKIDDMLDAVMKLGLTALISESKDYYRYDLTEEQKINVKAYQDSNLKLEFDVGKTASSFRHTFIRLPGDERVFHAQGNLKKAFDVTVDSLRDKKVLTLKPDEIQQVNVVKDKQALAFNRTQVPVEVKATDADKDKEAATPPPRMVWQAATGEPVNESALNQLLNAVADLRCERFIDDRKKEDFTSPLFSLDLKGVQDYSLSVFPKADEKDAGYPAISSGSDYPFQLSESTVNRFMKEPSELLQTPKTEMEKPEPTKTE